MKDWDKFKKVPQELRDKISNHPESLIGRDYLDYLSYIFSFRKEADSRPAPLLYSRSTEGTQVSLNGNMG